MGGFDGFWTLRASLDQCRLDLPTVDTPSSESTQLIGTLMMTTQRLTLGKAR